MRVPKKVLKLGSVAVCEWRIETVIEMAQAANKPVVVAVQEAVRDVLPKSATPLEIRSLGDLVTKVLLEEVELEESRVEVFVDRFSRDVGLPPPPPLVPKQKGPLAGLPPVKQGVRREVIFHLSRPEPQRNGKVPHFRGRATFLS